MLRKKKGVGLRGRDDKTESTREDAEEDWELVALAETSEKEGQELLSRKPTTQEDIEANMAAGQEPYASEHHWTFVVSPPTAQCLSHS